MHKTPSLKRSFLIELLTKWRNPADVEGRHSRKSKTPSGTVVPNHTHSLLQGTFGCGRRSFWFSQSGNGCYCHLVLEVRMLPNFSQCTESAPDKGGLDEAVSNTKIEKPWSTARRLLSSQPWGPQCSETSQESRSGRTLDFMRATALVPRRSASKRHSEQRWLDSPCKISPHLLDWK